MRFVLLLLFYSLINAEVVKKETSPCAISDTAKDEEIKRLNSLVQALNERSAAMSAFFTADSKVKQIEATKTEEKKSEEVKKK